MVYVYVMSDMLLSAATPLAPADFLTRSASVHGDRTALEAHFAVPWAGGVLNALNTRLSASELRYILEHAGTSVLVVDQSLRVVAEEAIRGLSSPPRLVVSGDRDTEYERLVAAAAPLRQEVADEKAMMALNYTSGTTGWPKGVMCSHRG